MDPPQINFVDNNSILIINPGGKIKQIFTPFRVQVLHDTNILKKNSWVVVEEIQSHKEYKMLYRITTNWWPYHLFRLQVNF